MQSNYLPQVVYSRHEKIYNNRLMHIKRSSGVLVCKSTFTSRFLLLLFFILAFISIVCRLRILCMPILSYKKDKDTHISLPGRICVQGQFLPSIKTPLKRRMLYRDKIQLGKEGFIEHCSKPSSYRNTR
ncbi:hypothetical protein VN97_g2933 [Penicillium thymicola]|uniref:Uncharacterized protein n=1 Tax=Penicillium thymicola TaxID=293382 RepID=A0AAI9TNA0_PENTH|nr:hypothetical protein VN97_g2933 [Penicillium thymicola]